MVSCVTLDTLSSLWSVLLMLSKIRVAREARTVMQAFQRTHKDDISQDKSGFLLNYWSVAYDKVTNGAFQNKLLNFHCMSQLRERLNRVFLDGLTYRLSTAQTNHKPCTAMLITIRKLPTDEIINGNKRLVNIPVYVHF